MKLRWLWNNLDVILFALALSSVGPLMAWWSILVRRNILAMDALTRANLKLLPDNAKRLAALDAHTARQLFMISGETVLAGLLLVTLAAVLFAIARKRRKENSRLQTMLQLTSHQLKTPVSGVRILLQSLGSGVVPQDMHAQLILRGIAECDRLEHLLDTILTFQRTVTHELGRIETIQSGRLVDEVLKTANIQDVIWAMKTPTPLACDCAAAQVVLENLLDNARKYGGNRVELSEYVEGQRWRLEVHDGGMGFEPSHAERLFEPFQREEGSSAERGSGLGLYIARQLAQQMRGKLSARSPGKGRGSTFIFELPVAEKSANEAARG